MKVITLLNEKGGVGKTTLSVMLAASLAHQGYRTLLIDGDSQGHATLSLRLNKEDGLFHLLSEDASFQQVIRPVHPDYYAGQTDVSLLAVIPSAAGTARLYKGLPVALLAARLAALRDKVDFVVMDTSPSISDLHTAFYLASDYIIYPTECTYYPIQGLQSSLSHLQAAQDKLTAHGYTIAKALAIIPTKFDGRESVQHQNYGWLRGKYGDDLVLPPIKRRTAWEQAAQLQTPIFLHDGTGKAGKEAQYTMSVLLYRMGVTHAA